MRFLKPNHTFWYLPKFTIHVLTKFDRHLGIVFRHVEDYAQDNLGAYRADLVVIALYKWIFSVGFTTRKVSIVSEGIYGLIIASLMFGILRIGYGLLH